MHVGIEPFARNEAPLRDSKLEEILPFGLKGQTLYLGQRHSRGIEGADDTAGARTGNSVYRDVLFFEDFQNRDVGNPADCPTGKGETDSCERSTAHRKPRTRARLVVRYLLT